jgi:hypothetical protein
MNLTRIIVLANSLKHGDFCLAGIDLRTGRWVRPVTNLDDGRVRSSDIRTGMHPPRLLDILDIPITDPVFCRRLTTGHEPSASCLLTMSLSMPHKPPEWQADNPPACWKLIAGIIELEEPTIREERPY